MHRVGEPYHPEKQILKVHCRPINWDILHELGNVFFVNFDISDLIADKVRADQRSRMLPNLTVTREYALAKQGSQCLVTIMSQIKVFEFKRQDGLHVLGLDRHDKGSAQAGFVRIAVLLVPASNKLQGPTFSHCREHIPQAVNPKE